MRWMKLPLAALAGASIGLGGGVAALWLITGSREAILFGLIPGMFLMPPFAVFLLASYRASRGVRPAGQRDNQAIAYLYLPTVIPFWVAALGAIQARPAWSLPLFAVYAVCCVIPLRHCYGVALRRLSSHYERIDSDGS